MSEVDDEDIPQLPPDTMAILQEFLSQKNHEDVAEDWQLSQFWYDEETTEKLVKTVRKLAQLDCKVALISCPTLMQPLLDENLDVVLFEFDARFKKFGEKFSFYDYRHPTDIDNRFHHGFDVVVADPPFLSEECLTKALETVRLLVRDSSSRIILCTGAVMENLAFELAQLKPCSFSPKHKNNLANEFRCYTNFGELPVDLK